LVAAHRVRTDRSRRGRRRDGAAAHGVRCRQGRRRRADAGARIEQTRGHRCGARTLQRGAPADRGAHHAAWTQARHASRRRSQDRRGPGDVEALAAQRGDDGLDRGSKLSCGVTMTRELPTPDYTRGMRIVGHCDQGSRPDGVQIMVHRGYAYVGHMFSKGFSVVDVRDAKRPRAVNYLAAPPGTWNIHLQTHDDLLLVINAKDMFAAAEFAAEKAD